MNKLLVTSAAEQDFTDSLRWYAERSRHAAEAFDAEFHRVLQSIGDQPDQFPFCDQRHRYAVMRRFPFQVIFREQGDHWTVVAVAHAKRRPNYWTSR
jgi:toxin ParE1/3/4